MTSTIEPGRRADVGRHSVDRFRDLVESGGFLRAAAVDRHTGEIVDSDARALFAALPAVTPATTPEELVDNQLIKRVPANLSRASDAPKYFVGRELFVKTNVNHRGSRRQPAGYYDAACEVSFTHRGVLLGRRGDDFLVDLAGAAEPLSFGHTEIYVWNEPVGVPTAGGSISGVKIDYNAPLFKAHVCAGYIEIAGELDRLDFSGEPDTVREHQARLVHRLGARIRMTYAGRGEGYGGARAESLLEGGQGVCFVQRAVAGAYLQAFSRTLALEIQIAVGRTLGLQIPHGFTVVTLRPSMRRFVCDPAWGEPLTDLRVAFFGSAWGHDRRLEGFEGEQNITVRPFEVDLPDEQTA
ncbi:MAG: hypothetical protein V3T05_02725 [Myxococcota bacterium]